MRQAVLVLSTDTLVGYVQMSRVNKIEPVLWDKCRYDVPLVADIHFQPVVANMVAECFEKIRVNPGNFVDGRKRFDEKVYDDDSQFKKEQENIREVIIHKALSGATFPFQPRAGSAQDVTL